MATTDYYYSDNSGWSGATSNTRWVITTGAPSTKPKKGANAEWLNKRIEEVCDCWK